MSSCGSPGSDLWGVSFGFVLGLVLLPQEFLPLPSEYYLFSLGCGLFEVGFGKDSLAGT